MIPLNQKRPASLSSATFDAKSTTYHDELHKAGFISKAQLQASKSGNKADLDKADAEVLEIAMVVGQHPLTGKQSETINSAFTSEQRNRDQLLENNYAAKGYVFNRNKGNGHNCLIISTLQHITGKYDSDHLVDAIRYRTRLNTELEKNLTEEQEKAFRRDAMLAPDHLPWLLNSMATDKSLGEKNLTIEVWMANAQGEPVSFSFGNGKEKAIIFQRADHFEAVTLENSASTATRNTSASGSS